MGGTLFRILLFRIYVFFTCLFITCLFTCLFTCFNLQQPGGSSDSPPMSDRRTYLADTHLQGPFGLGVEFALLPVLFAGGRGNDGAPGAVQVLGKLEHAAQGGQKQSLLPTEQDVL